MGNRFLNRKIIIGAGSFFIGQRVRQFETRATEYTEVGYLFPVGVSSIAGPSLPRLTKTTTHGWGAEVVMGSHSQLAPTSIIFLSVRRP